MSMQWVLAKSSRAGTKVCRACVSTKNASSPSLRRWHTVCAILKRTMNDVDPIL